MLVEAWWFFNDMEKAFHENRLSSHAKDELMARMAVINGVIDMHADMTEAESSPGTKTSLLRASDSSFALFAFSFNAWQPS